MEKNKIRRVPVVDQQGRISGIVSQADIAVKTDRSLAAEVVEKVSESTETPSLVGYGR